MPFFNIFLKTLGFFIGVTTFVIIINLILYISSTSDQNFELIKGDDNSKNIIATFDLNGPIINSFNQPITGNVISYIDPKKVEKYLSEITKINPEILIIKINSPGGTVSATVSLENIINKFKKENKIDVYFFTDQILASGGYWVATTGDKIFAQYGSIIGSIGVSGPSWYYYDQPISISTGIFRQKIETKNGIQIFDQNVGNSKDLFNPFRKPTKKELGHLQNMIKDIYDDFLVRVSQSRKIEISILKNEIGALIYSGNQAKDIFLIDDIIDFDKLINKIALNKDFKNYKLLKMQINDNFINKYLSNYFTENYDNLCNELNSNFTSVFPIFLNRC